MNAENLSIESASAIKAADIAVKAQVAVFKKALDSQEQVSQTLIASARVLPEGVGSKLNTVA